MRRALELAARGRRTVAPNPAVGCVLVRDGGIVGEGWHERPGRPHAEVLALRAAGERAAGAVAYVTLEPCGHTGRTPPCTEALIEAGVAKVVAAMTDPHPLGGGGAGQLRAAGIPVEVGPCEDEARRLNEAYLHALTHGRPLVVCKAAVSLDGRIAAADGTSQWLTSPATRRLAHTLRAEADAVVVGSGTVLADDPQLTVRDDGGRLDGPQPLRVVLDGRARTPAAARVLDQVAPTLVCVAPHADAAGLAAAGAKVERPPAGPQGGVDLGRVLALLWEREVRSVLVEGGAQVLSAFLDAGLCDRLVLHTAPVLLGSSGRPMLLGGPATLAGATRLRLESLERCGDDVVARYRRR